MSPWTIFVRSALVCALVGALIFGLSLKRIERLPLSGAPLGFDGKRAHQYMTELSKGFPDRVTWADSRKKAALWLKGQLHELGYEPKGMLFSETIAGQHYTDLENVYAEKLGTKHPDEIIVVAGHYDITDTTHEGAMDDASGVAVVLELARVLAKEPTDRTIVFLLTDSEEFGAFWGARAFARQYEKRDRIVAAANFDFLAPEKQEAILTLCDGLKQGYTPLWLRELALDSLRSIGGFEVLDMTNLMETIERAMQIPPADHGAFLQAGIPSFNWVGQMKHFARQMAHYHHTNYDVAEAMRPESFSDYGRAAERLVRSISELPRVPDDFRNSSYLKISAQTFLEGWVVTLLHVLAFIPFLVFSVAKFGAVLRRRPPELVRKVTLNEAKHLGIMIGALLLGYVIILLMPALQVITLYEVFPATQKSALLYHPNFIAIFVVLAAVVGVYLTFRKVFRERDDDLVHLEIRHALHGALLTAIIVLAIVKNSYLAFLLLLPPAYLWTALRARRKTEDRILNTLLLAGGAITFVTMAVVLSTIFHVGVVYWYLFLSAAYGLISAYAVVLFFMALAVMIRLFRAFVL